MTTETIKCYKTIIKTVSEDTPLARPPGGGDEQSTAERTTQHHHAYIAQQWNMGRGINHTPMGCAPPCTPIQGASAPAGNQRQIGLRQPLAHGKRLVRCGLTWLLFEMARAGFAVSARTRSLTFMTYA
jgi:hypothetical protein